MKRIQAVVLLVVLAMIAAACGGSSDETTTTAGDGGGETTTTLGEASLEGVELKLWGLVLIRRRESGALRPRLGLQHRDGCIG